MAGGPSPEETGGGQRARHLITSQISINFACFLMIENATRHIDTTHIHCWHCVYSEYESLAWASLAVHLSGLKRTYLGIHSGCRGSFSSSQVFHWGPPRTGAGAIALYHRSRWGQSFARTVVHTTAMQTLSICTCHFLWINKLFMTSAYNYLQIKHASCWYKPC